jgi:hypothetical protein
MAHPSHFGSPVQLSPQEQSVVEAVGVRRDALVALTIKCVQGDRKALNLLDIDY